MDKGKAGAAAERVVAAASPQHSAEQAATPGLSRRPHRPLSAVIQRAAADPRSLTRADAVALQRTIGNAAVRQLVTGAVPNENRTGMPDRLKAGVENLSGLAMDDVRVHYNSSKPAQVQALAYAQGTDIHVAPGQEKHLPHEAWHVVQQKQGRVTPTLQMKDVAINDDRGLEGEADAMAMRLAAGPQPDDLIAGGSHGQRRTDNIIQRVPVGTYSAATPSGSGFKWDRRTTGSHKGETVPMHVIAVMRNPADGGVPSVDPPGWAWLKKKFGRLKGQWVRFHIVNAQLGGPGNKELNLVPTRHTVNHDAGWRRVEEGAKDNASTKQRWTYLEVQLTYDVDFPKGIPQKIQGEWGTWSSSSDSWVQKDTSGTLRQSNPKLEADGDYLPATQITLGMLKGWGLNGDQAAAAKALISADWKNQDAFESAWAGDDMNFNHGDILVDKTDVQGRMYVDEDDAHSGPYGVVVKTA